LLGAQQQGLAVDDRIDDASIKVAQRFDGLLWHARKNRLVIWMFLSFGVEAKRPSIL
jgi:hypothetical protein